MCLNCWREAGSPVIDNEQVRAAVALIAAVYEGHSVGGGLHLALDDYNLSDEDIAWCDAHLHEYADPENIDIERACCAALKVLTEEERYAAVGAFHGDWTLPGPGTLQ